MTSTVAIVELQRRPGLALFLDNVTLNDQGNFFTTWVDLYAEIVRIRTLVGGTYGIGQHGKLQVGFRGGPTHTIPAGTYDLSDVVLNGRDAGLTLELADGVVFSGANMPEFANWYRLNFLCVTTSVYNGPSPGRLTLVDCYIIRTGSAATVPAFNITSGILTVLSSGGNFGGDGSSTPSETGTSALVGLDGTAECDLVLDDWNFLISNPFSNTGTNVIRIHLVEANTAASGSLGAGGTAAAPFAVVYGTTATTITDGNQVIEGYGTLREGAYRIPAFSMPGRGFKNTYLHEVRIKDGLHGRVQPDSASTIAGNRIIFGGISHGTVVNTLSANGYNCLFMTGAVSGNENGWASTLTLCNRTARGYAVFKFTLVDITNIRLFIGLTGTHIGASRSGSVDSDAPTGNLAGLQFSTDRGDTTFQFLTQQAAGAQNLINSTVTVSAATYYVVVDLKFAGQITITLLSSTGSRLGFTTVTNAALIPAAASAMGMNMMLETRSAAAKQFMHHHAQLTIGERV